MAHVVSLPARTLDSSGEERARHTDTGEMFFYGEPPWHDIGHPLSTAATLYEALRHGALRWEAKEFGRIAGLKVANWHD